MIKRIFAIIIVLLPIVCIAATHTVGGLADPSSIGGVANADIATIGGVTFTQAGGDPCADYLVCQGFEGTGYDNSESWTEDIPASSIINEDYTTTALVGSQSLYIKNGGAWDDTDTSTTFTAQSTVHFYLQVRPITTVNGENYLFQLMDGSNNQMLAFGRQSDTQVRLYCGSTNSTQNYTMSSGTTYHIWGDYTKGSGDAACHLYVDTDNTKPAATVTITNGNATEDVAKVKLMISTSSANKEWIYDHLLIKTSSIGDAP